MASIVIAVLGLLSISLIPVDSSKKFVTVSCQKPVVVAQFGSNVLLDCVIQTDLSDVNIQFVSWGFNEKSILSFQEGKSRSEIPNVRFAHERGMDQSIMNVSLLITNTGLAHSGRYVCDVLTDSGHDRAEVELTVKSNYSKAMIDSDPEKVTSDKAFTLTCRAQGGFPLGHLRWVVNDEEWKKNPEVVVTNASSGLFDLTSTLPVGADSQFTKFVCEVFNDQGVKESQGTFHLLNQDQMTGPDSRESLSLTKTVAPVVVIGSLIVGLLAVLLVCRRRRNKARRPSEAPLMNVPETYPVEDIQTPDREEAVPMV